MNEFTLHIPTHIYFGSSHAEAFAKRAAEFGKTVLLVTGGGSVERLGYLQIVQSAFEKAGCTVLHHSGIEPNPEASTINRIAAEGREAGVDAVLALGGGSAMDAAKAIAALIHDAEEDIWPFTAGNERRGKLQGALPIFAVPTTAATASEVTPYAVISSRTSGGKAPIAYEFIKPRASWINPEFTTKLPAATTQDGAADILSHVFENYLLGGIDAPFTDRYCESIMLTVMETLPKVLHDPENPALRGTLLWCATCALNGMHAAGRRPSVFPLHAIEHAMSAVNPELAHGRGLATLFPAYFRWLWNEKRAHERLNQLATRLFFLPEGTTSGLRFIEQFEHWLKENNLLQSAPEVGVPKEKYAAVAEYAVTTYGDGSAMDVLGPMTAEQIVQVLELTETQAGS